MAVVIRKRIAKGLIAAFVVAGLTSPAFAFENSLPSLPGTAMTNESIDVIENTLPLGIPCPNLTDHAVDAGPVSRWWRSGRDGITPTQIVIHTTESDRVVGGAFNVASWLSRTNYRASAHFVVDVEQTLITVDIEDTAWGVGGPQNNSGVQIELVGEASSTREEWLSPSGASQLCRAAALTAQIAQVYDIPLRLVEAPGLRVGTAGVVGHHAYSEAFGISTHTDPGPGFPWDAFLAQAASYLTEAAAVQQLPMDRLLPNKPSGPVSDSDTKNEPLPELSELYRILEELEADISEEKLDGLAITGRILESGNNPS